MGKESYNLLQTKANDPTTAAFGTKLDGSPFAADLSDGPHWIVAGQTGSGKSVYMNSLLMSIMYHSSPKELEIYAVDPKKVEFGIYKGIPFMPVPPVTDPSDAYGLVAYITWLMDDRYEYLEDVEVKNIKEYNQLFDYGEKWIEELSQKVETFYDTDYIKKNVNISLNDDGSIKEMKKQGSISDKSIKELIELLKNEGVKLSDEPEKEEVTKSFDRLFKQNNSRLVNLKRNYHKIKNGEGHKRMTYIVTVIDEYADLVMTNSEIEDLVVRLAQKARACGITLLIATQRPSASIISPTIKANVPARIGLKVTDSTNSSIVIDEPGLEKLKGYGDSVVVMKDGTQERVQGPFITNDEIIAAFDYLKEEFGSPEFFDYKQKAVDLGLVQWAEDYDEDTPWEEKHVKKPKKRMFG